MKKILRHGIFILIILTALDVFVWRGVVSGIPSREASLHFLDVGQGDSELLLLPGDVAILTDAGPDKSVLRSLEKVFSSGRHYIDVGIVSHPQLDHYGGFRELIRHYHFGVIITNGRDATSAQDEWRAFLDAAREDGTQLIVLGAGSEIRHGESTLRFLEPDAPLAKSKELNDTSFVERIDTPSFSALLTGDIGLNVEQLLIKENAPIDVDILKVGHHGSKYASSMAFLAKVQPLLVAIEVGAKNIYKHPTKETLARLASSTAQTILRTDTHGTISILPENGVLRIFTEE
ncbi:MAG: hypothetical protein NUV53_01865 [Patescibacteria group bacterium]|nr:hypothetical protein [Patescibacteria group bacterium]